MWLSPVALAPGLGFSASELREVERLVSPNRALLLKAWEEFKAIQGERVTDIATTEDNLIVDPAD